MNRQFWLALMVAAVIVVPRSVLVCGAQSEGFDDEYHLSRGVDFWHRGLEPARLNDPPLGEGISALPLVVCGVRVPDDGHVLYGQRFSTSTLLLMVGVWKAVLFLPLVAGVFWWLRRVYGLMAAWGGAVLLCVEPNFAAFVPSAGLDVLACEGIFFACVLAWRYFERPSVGRLIWMCVGIAVALLLKHTGVVVPILVLFFGVVWVVTDWICGGRGDLLSSASSPSPQPFHPAISADVRSTGERELALRKFAGHLVFGIVIVLVTIWVLLLFDVSKPKGPKDLAVLNGFERGLTEHRLPGGTYIGSIIMARAHVDRGHPAFLLGERSLHGWWYYFPVVATFKVPIGVAVMLLASIASLALVRFKFDEWMAVIGFVGASAFFMSSGISIGFRHFLPAYLFALMLAARCFVVPVVMWRAIGWIGVAATAIHGFIQHPNYIAYTNFPRQHVWLKISDSNLEWGQSLKQVGQWIESHAELRGRPIYVAHYLAERGPHAAAYLPAGVVALHSENPPPASGILIISPTWLVSAYQAGDLYGDLRMREPIDVIAGAMLVYDLDRPNDHPARKHKAPRSTRSSK